MAVRAINPKHFGIKQLSKLFCTSIPKIRVALIAQGVMTPAGEPSRPEYARSRILEDGQLWFSWDAEVACTAITAHGITRRTAIPTSPFASRTQAEEKLWAAMARIGELARLDKPAPDWTDEQHQAALIYQQVQSRTPRFIGSPCAFASVASSAEARELRERFRQATKGYFALALAAAGKRQLQEPAQVVDSVFDWLCRLRK